MFAAAGTVKAEDPQPPMEKGLPKLEQATVAQYDVRHGSVVGAEVAVRSSPASGAGVFSLRGDDDVEPPSVKAEPGAAQVPADANEPAAAAVPVAQAVSPAVSEMAAEVARVRALPKVEFTSGAEEVQFRARSAALKLLEVVITSVPIEGVGSVSDALSVPERIEVLIQRIQGRQARRPG